MRLCRKSRVLLGGIHCLHERTAHQEEVQICNFICGSLLGPEVRSLHVRDNIIGDYIRQENFWEACSWLQCKGGSYHCNNGRFTDNVFIHHYEVMSQGITYCGVNAHFQNGRTEKAIRDFQTMARKMILHAKGRCPKAIYLSLWPYTLRMAVHVHNNFPNDADASSHLEAFTRIFVSPNLVGNDLF